MINLFVGTETGTAEYVADEIIELLENNGLECQLVEYSNGMELNQDSATTWLFCTSTHGAGEVPDNLKPIYQWVLSQEDLSPVKHLVIGLGDSSYDTYCQAANDLNTALIKRKSSEINPPILYDAMSSELPEDLIIPQLETILAKLK